MSAVWLGVLIVAAVGGLAIACLALGLVAWRMRRAADGEGKALLRRIVRLPLRRKLRLLLAVARDPRIPLAVRAIPPALVLYLAMPIDVIPDFIPVLGHLDDALIVVIGLGLLLRFVPRDVLDEHVERLEPAEAGTRP
jgi:uncharacterized membrane protein YkvA (DUF1232 family)